MARTSSDSSSGKAEDSASSSKRDAAAKGKSDTTKAETSSSAKRETARPKASTSNDTKAKTGTAKPKSDSAKSTSDAAKSKTDASKSTKPKPKPKAKAELSKARDEERGPGFFGTIALFLRQVMAELKKVVTPTRAELFRYTGVVLVFVIIMMALVAGLDLLFGWGASWAFGTGQEVQWPDFSGLFGGDPAATDPAATAPAVPAE